MNCYHEFESIILNIKNKVLERKDFQSNLFGYENHLIVKI